MVYATILRYKEFPVNEYAVMCAFGKRCGIPVKVPRKYLKKFVAAGCCQIKTMLCVINRIMKNIAEIIKGHVSIDVGILIT